MRGYHIAVHAGMYGVVFLLCMGCEKQDRYIPLQAVPESPYPSYNPAFYDHVKENVESAHDRAWREHQMMMDKKSKEKK